MEITRKQCRAARALLDWSMGDLAARARVPGEALAAFESGASGLRERDLAEIRRTLETGGIAFIPEGDGDGVGVRLRGRSGPADEGLHPSQLTSENTD